MIQRSRCIWLLLMALGIIVAIDAALAQPDLLNSVDATDHEFWAGLAGVDDIPSFVGCLEEGGGLAAVVRDSIVAADLGIAITPAITVNEMMFEGYPGFDRLHEAVRQSLRSKQKKTGIDLQGRDPYRWRFTKMWEMSATTHDFMTSDNMTEASVGTDAEGNVYILSEQSAKVFVVSKSGELIDSIGNRGSGPGELSNPRALDVTDGVLYVFDFTGTRRWTLPDRALMPRLQMNEFLNVSGRFRGSGNGFLASEAAWTGSDARGDIWEHNLVRWNSEVGKTLVAPGPVSTYTPFESPACIAGVVMPSIFAPTLAWDISGDLMAIASSGEYAVEVFRGGQPAGKIARNTEPRPVTRTMLRREVEDLTWGRPGNQCVIPAEQVIEARGYAEFLAPVADLVLSPNEEIWVLRGRVKDEPRTIDVFAATGDFLGTLAPNSPFPAAFAGPGSMLATGSGDFGSTLAMYSIARH